MNARPRCLFVTRKYPPRVGGMETLAVATARALDEPFDLTVLALGRSQSHLAWWLPLTAARIARAVKRDRTDVVVFGDALTYAALAPLVGRRLPHHMVMVMGLDLTYPRPWYQRAVRRSLPRAPQVVAISRATADEALARGVVPDRLRVVAPGVLDAAGARVRVPEAGAELRAALGIAPGATVLLTLGRLVPRKGVRWFVTDVMRDLPSDVVYVVAGSGPDADAIAAAVASIGPAGARVMVLGSVDDARRDLLFAGADLFVMPNVDVPGDMEGFGLVAIEAAAAGALVVASELEGIRDAVIDGETGVLVPSRDAAAFRERITELVNDPEERSARAQRYALAARETFSIARMRADLVAVLSPVPPA